MAKTWLLFLTIKSPQSDYLHCITFCEMNQRILTGMPALYCLVIALLNTSKKCEKPAGQPFKLHILIKKLQIKNCKSGKLMIFF